MKLKPIELRQIAVLQCSPREAYRERESETGRKLRQTKPIANIIINREGERGRQTRYIKVPIQRVSCKYQVYDTKKNIKIPYRLSLLMPWPQYIIVGPNREKLS